MPCRLPCRLRCPAGQVVAEGQVDGRAVDVHVRALASKPKHACRCPGQLRSRSLASHLNGTEQPMCALRAGPLTLHRQAAGTSSRGSGASEGWHAAAAGAAAPLAVQLLHVLLRQPQACMLAQWLKQQLQQSCHTDLCAAHAPLADANLQPVPRDRVLLCGRRQNRRRAGHLPSHLLL